MLKDLKPTLLMMLKFGGIYFLLFLLYQLYLNYYEQKGLDVFSIWVSKQVGFGLSVLGYSVDLIPKPLTQSVWFIIENKAVTQMVEGCNAISVMILFISFVFTFYKGWKTFVFAFCGLFIVHVCNVIRIVGLSSVYFETPQYGKMVHDYLFPSFIYGVVVLLWLIWIQYFALKPYESR